MNCKFCNKELKGKRIKWCSDKCQYKGNKKTFNKVGRPKKLSTG